jgi:hypothetical protein
MMRYINHILLPNEKVRYSAHVHPILLAPGLLLIFISAMMLALWGDIAGEHFIFARMGRWLGDTLPGGPLTYHISHGLRSFGESWGTDTKLASLCFLIPGLISLSRAIELIYFTELVVTDRRVIAKTGVMTTHTSEISSARITEINVDQTIWGRLFGYGKVHLQGFTGDIAWLPVLASPYSVQRALNR